MAEPGSGSGSGWLQRSRSRANQSVGLQVAWLARCPMSSCIPFAALAGGTRMLDHRRVARVAHLSAPEESETSPLLPPALCSKSLQTLLKVPPGSHFPAPAAAAQGPRVPGLVQSGVSKRQRGEQQEVARRPFYPGSASNGCDFGQAGKVSEFPLPLFLA